MDKSKAKQSSSTVQSSSSALMSNKSTKINNNAVTTIKGGHASIFKLTSIGTWAQPKIVNKRTEQKEEEDKIQKNPHQHQKQQEIPKIEKKDENKPKKQKENRVKKPKEHKLDETEFENPLVEAKYFVTMTEPLKIVITEKISSSEFYFGCDSSSEFRQKLPELEKIMGSWYETNLIPENIRGPVKPNGIYVLWMDFNYCKRVRIVNDFDPSSSVVQVHLIDWGTFRRVFVEDLYPMRKKYMKYLPILSMLGKCDLVNLPEDQKKKIDELKRVVFDAVGYFQRSKIMQNHPDVNFKEFGVKLKFHEENKEVLT